MVLMKNVNMAADMKSVQKVFDQMDKNRDGSISWAEFSESFALNILRVTDD